MSQTQAHTCQIGESRARPLITSHSVKTRAYFGNTSMEAEMGFLMAGQTLVRGRPYTVVTCGKHHM